MPSKDLAFRTRFAQGKQPHLGSPSADESSEDVSNDHNEGAHSATTTGRGKVLPGKKLHRVLPTAKNRSAKAQCVYFDFTANIVDITKCRFLLEYLTKIF